MGVVRSPQTIGEFEIATLTNGRFKENCYVVVRGGLRDCLIVDPGSEERFLSEYLDARDLHPRKILLTHGHFDHLGAVDALMRRYEAVCEVQAAEERLVRQAATYAFRFAREALRVPRGLRFVQEGPLDWNGLAIDVLPTPGHTSGSVALAVGGEFVFTGDTLFRERVGPTTYPESDAVAMIASVNRLLEHLPGDCVLFPGHGRAWSIGEARAWWAGLPGPPPAERIF
jgi:hydroxyacylglutathione hydrolase